MIKTLLKQKYPLPEWALIFELNKGTGFKGTERRADAVVFNCYPSKGSIRYAFEIKTSRGDFIRELNNPQKRKWLEDNFHETYFVTTHKLVKDTEIPEGWGLLSVTSKGDALRRSVIPRHREVPELPESMALSAIRSLASSLNDLDVPYVLNGREVCKQDVEQWANQILDHQHKTLQEGIKTQSKLNMELRELREGLLEPFKVLREAVERCDYYAKRELDKEPLNIITVDAVRSWLVQVANTQARALLKDAIKARDALTDLINKTQ